MQLLSLTASAHQFGLAGHMAVNKCAGLVPTDTGTSLNELALKNKLVAGLNTALETSLVNAGKEKQSLFPALFFRQTSDAEHGTGLSHCFDDEHSGHHGVFGKMPGVLRFVCRHVLENLAHSVIIAALKHSVNQKKWKTVRQNPHDVMNGFRVSHWGYLICLLRAVLESSMWSNYRQAESESTPADGGRKTKKY